MISSCIQKSERSTDPPEQDADSSIVAPQEEPVDPPADTIVTTGPATVDIGVYVEYPEAIDGCACYFGRTATELSEGKYIFMTNYEKKAYMTLDGKMRVFEQISSEDLSDGRLMERWENEEYDMVVTSKETGQIDETWQSIGTINIKPNDKESTTISVVGECGC